MDKFFLINCISDDDTVHVRDLLDIWYIIKIWLAGVKNGMAFLVVKTQSTLKYVAFSKLLLFQ